MKKRTSRTKTRTRKKTSAPTTPPDSPARQNARSKVDDFYPSHDLSLVAQVAASLAPIGKALDRRDGARIARNALSLLDGVRDVLKERERTRSNLLEKCETAEEIPDRLGFADGKLFILGTDSGGADARFNDLLKANIKSAKYLSLRADRLSSGMEEPSRDEIPETTAKELNLLRSRYVRGGFSAFDLEMLKQFYGWWRTTVDGRRKKK